MNYNGSNAKKLKEVISSQEENFMNKEQLISQTKLKRSLCVFPFRHRY